MTADARVTLQTALSSAQYFAAVILMHFYSRELLIELFDTPEHIDEGYSQFVRHFVTSILYPCLQSRLKQIRIQRDVLRHMCNKVVNMRFWERIVVHRAKDDGNGKTLEGKRIVLDPMDTTRFPEDEFIHVYSEMSHIIDSTMTQVEFHVLESRNRLARFVIVEQSGARLQRGQQTRCSQRRGKSRSSQCFHVGCRVDDQ